MNFQLLLQDQKIWQQCAPNSARQQSPQHADSQALNSLQSLPYLSRTFLVEELNLATLRERHCRQSKGKDTEGTHVMFTELN